MRSGERLLRDLNPLGRRHDPDGALNHSMLYLVMGHDDARGAILFDAPWHEPDGRIRVSWDQAGQQQVFTRINDELRRHARALRGNFISNPTWSVFRPGHLITAHPLGGMPHGRRPPARRGGRLRALSCSATEAFIRGSSWPMAR